MRSVHAHPKKRIVAVLELIRRVRPLVSAYRDHGLEARATILPTILGCFPRPLDHSPSVAYISRELSCGTSTALSLELCILASGSSGNSSLLRTPGGVVMIDAGLGPAMFRRRLEGTGVTLNDLRAIVLTHLDADHYRREWGGEALRRGMKIFCHARRRDDVAAGCDDVLEVTRTFYPHRPFEPLPGVRFEAIPLAHDEEGCHGFVIEHADTKVGFATDLGHVPDTLIDRFCDVDIIAIESNYDPDMQLASPRPLFLKNRITGGSGHLSNQQAFDAVRSIFDRCGSNGHALPGHVVLLHRSRQCNCPRLVKTLFEQDPRIGARVVLSEPYDRTDWLRPRNVDPAAGEQLTLSFDARHSLPR